MMLMLWTLGPTRVWRLSRNIPLRQRQGGASCMWDLDKAFTLRRVIGEYIRLRQYHDLGGPVSRADRDLFRT